MAFHYSTTTTMAVRQWMPSLLTAFGFCTIVFLPSFDILGNVRWTMKSNASSAPLSLPLSTKDTNTEDPTPQPNLVFILTDQQRYDTLSNPTLTKHIQRLVREGVSFENAFTAAPVCGPARTALLTGLALTNSLAATNGNLTGRPGLVSYDALLKNYSKEYYGKFHSSPQLNTIYDNPVLVRGANLYLPYQAYLKSRNYTLPGPLTKNATIREGLGQQAYIPSPVDSRYAGRKPKHVWEFDQVGVSTIPSKDSLTAFTGQQGLEALQRLSRQEKPFSLHISFNAPHAPHTPSEPYASWARQQNWSRPVTIEDPRTDGLYHQTWRKAFTEHYQEFMAMYYAQILEVDEWVGHLLDAMDEHDLTENTLVIFSSDHGEMLTSHGMIEKTVLYEEAVHIPLLMRFPGHIPAVSAVSEPVSHRDVFGTILDYLGMPPVPFDGTSLRPLIEGRRNDWKFMFNGTIYAVSENGGPKELLVVDDNRRKLLLSLFSKKQAVLYDLRNDPHELINLIGKSFPEQRRQYLPEAYRLKDMLEDWCRKVHSPHLEYVRSRVL